MNLKCREKVVIAVEKSSQSWRAQDSLLRSAAAAAVVAFLRATAVTTARISNASCIDSTAYCLKSIFPCGSCHSCDAQLPVLFSFFRVSRCRGFTLILSLNIALIFYMVLFSKIFVKVKNLDQNQDFSLNSNNRPKFHILKTPTKYSLDSRIPQKCVVSTDGTYKQTERQTNKRKLIMLFIRSRT